jgi:hypothetical protein
MFITEVLTACNLDCGHYQPATALQAVRKYVQQRCIELTCSPINTENVHQKQVSVLFAKHSDDQSDKV